ncbi:MAG TPA: tripartite tricarboxylate transporter TctB family protein [Candidatus Atribacteria bacterium]|nr:tripartite tricarboxylate transporter TctB family protein [Candidatus Atribacteria bacterium]
MGKKEILLSIFFMIISMAIYFLTFQFPKQTVALSPKVFPQFVSVGLFLLSLILLLQGISGAKKESEQKKVKSDLNKTVLIKILIMIILAFLYLRILPLAGYLIATPLFLAGSMLLFNEKRWFLIVTISIFATVLFYILFRIVFRIPLPRFNLF